jgi:hypothetical protein
VSEGKMRWKKEKMEKREMETKLKGCNINL